jgi:hypothetical protein
MVHYNAGRVMTRYFQRAKLKMGLTSTCHVEVPCSIHFRPVPGWVHVRDNKITSPDPGRKSLGVTAARVTSSGTVSYRSIQQAALLPGCDITLS